MKKLFASFLCFACFSAALSADGNRMAPLIFPSTASNGMGGSHVAYTSDIYALFVNPAAMQWANQTSILELSPAIIGPLDKFAKSGSTILGAIEGLDDIDPLLDVIEGGKLSLGMDIRGPLSAGYVANGLGFGIFSRVFVDARFIGTDIDATTYADVMLPFGLAFNVLRLQDHELAAGFVLKPFIRVMAGLETSALDFVGNADSLAETSVPVLGGLGNNLGLLYRFRRDLTVGLTLDDLYTFGARMSNINGESSHDIYQVPLSLNLGAAYTFKLTSLWEEAPRALQSTYIAAMIDWHSLNNVFTWNDRLHRNPVLDLGMGAEFGFFNFLKLRVGLHDMLPMIGLGLEPRIFKFNIALYGKELGSEPGVNSTMALDISVALRLDTKKKTWPWSTPFLK